MTAAY